MGQIATFATPEISYDTTDDEISEIVARARDDYLDTQGTTDVHFDGGITLGHPEYESTFEDHINGLEEDTYLCLIRERDELREMEDEAERELIQEEEWDSPDAILALAA